MKQTITGLHTELGGLLARGLAQSRTTDTHFNLAGQQANSLLHDGHAWKHFHRKALEGTRAAIDAARLGKASILVHASFAFVYAVEDGAHLAEPLRTSVQAVLDCEALVFASQVPACVVRLGYLYGPDSADLRAYRTAFQLLRPYWCGPPKENQYHLHQFDAVTALIGVAKPQNLGKTFYAVDSHPASFARFLDSFAHRTGRARPLHFPLWTRPLAKLMIAEEHMQQTELSMPRLAPGPLVPRWRPQFSGYRDGLKQVINAWDNESV